MFKVLYQTVMASTTIFDVNRYKFSKEFIASGKLFVIAEGQHTTLIYNDDKVEERASALYYPKDVLEKLRNQLEVNHQSFIAINGCRIDTDYRFDASFNSYIIEHGKKATENLHMFEPTLEIEKLCTVEQHKAAYDEWLESFMPEL